MPSLGKAHPVAAKTRVRRLIVRSGTKEKGELDA
jgi:hypothetical protein